MSTTQGVPRPRQVTLAATLVMAASALLVLSVFERLGSLRSLESRTAIERFVSQPPGSELGIGAEAVIELIRTVSMVAAGLATAAAVLGFHVLRGNRAARIGLSVLAVPLFLCGLVTGGFLASVVAASVAMLWLAPSRLWFSGAVPPRGPDPFAAPTGQPGQAAVPPRPPQAAQTAQPPYLTPYGTRPPPRPTALAVACGLTWVCCTFTVMVCLLLLGVLSADAAGLFAEVHRQNPSLADQGVSDATLRSGIWVMALGCVVWATASGVLAVLAFRRARWAVIALTVSAGVIAVCCLAASLVSPALVVPGVLAATTGVLLMQPAVHRWLDRRADPHAAPTQRPPGP